MSQTEVYYFSATGNSLAVARDIAGKIGGKLIPVISVLDGEVINTKAETIGIVFPIYDFKPPKIIDDFVKRLADIDSQYIFAVGTYGAVPLKAIKEIEKDIAECGGRLSGGFLVPMPHSGIGYKNSAARQEKMFAAWDKKLEEIAAYVETRKEGHLETTNVLVHFILSGFIFKTLPSLVPLFWHVTRNGWESLKFSADEKCTGCGTCTWICPVKNIEMVENKPRWSDDCLNCFACLQWCPEESVQAGKITVDMKRYHHPDVKLSELLR